MSAGDESQAQMLAYCRRIIADMECEADALWAALMDSDSAYAGDAGNISVHLGRVRKRLDKLCMAAEEAGR